MSTKVKERGTFGMMFVQPVDYSLDNLINRYSFSLSQNAIQPTDSSASLSLTNDWYVPVLELGGVDEKPIVIQKAKIKRPYYPSDEMYGCIGARLLEASGNKQQPFRDVSHGGQPQQFYAPFSRGGVRFFQNPTMYKSVSQVAPGPWKSSLGCSFPVPPATKKIIFPCAEQESEYAVYVTGNSLSSIDLDKRAGQDRLIKPERGSKVTPTRAPASLTGRTRGYGGVVALSGTQVSRNSWATDMHFRRPLPSPLSGNLTIRSITKPPLKVVIDEL